MEKNMDPATQYQHVTVMRVGIDGDTYNLYCEVLTQEFRRVILSISKAAMPSFRTRTLMSLIRPNDKAALQFVADEHDQHGIRVIKTLLSLEIEQVRPDNEDYPK